MSAAFKRIKTLPVCPFSPQRVFLSTHLQSSEVPSTYNPYTYTMRLIVALVTLFALTFSFVAAFPVAAGQGVEPASLDRLASSAVAITNKAPRSDSDSGPAEQRQIPTPEQPIIPTPPGLPGGGGHNLPRSSSDSGPAQQRQIPTPEQPIIPTPPGLPGGGHVLPWAVSSLCYIRYLILTVL